MMAKWKLGAAFASILFVATAAQAADPLALPAGRGAGVRSVATATATATHAQAAQAEVRAPRPYLEVRADARAAGRAAAVNHFLLHARGSASGQGYYDKYGSHWDAVNHKEPPAPLQSLPTRQVLQQEFFSAPERFEQLKPLIAQTKMGREALAWAEKYGVEVKWVDADAAYYTGGTNTMVLGTKYAPENAAATFIHEMNHARFHNEGWTPSAKKVDRDAYVSAMLHEEAMGETIVAETGYMRGALWKDVGQYRPAVKAYRAAYAKVFAEERAAREAAARP